MPLSLSTTPEKIRRYIERNQRHKIVSQTVITSKSNNAYNPIGKYLFKVNHGIIHLVRTQNFPKRQYFLHPDKHTFACILRGKKC